MRPARSGEILEWLLVILFDRPRRTRFERHVAERPAEPRRKQFQRQPVPERNSDLLRRADRKGCQDGEIGSRTAAFLSLRPLRSRADGLHHQRTEGRAGDCYLRRRRRDSHFHFTPRSSSRGDNDFDGVPYEGHDQRLVTVLRGPLADHWIRHVILPLALVVGAATSPH